MTRGNQRANTTENLLGVLNPVSVKLPYGTHEFKIKWGALDAVGSTYPILQRADALIIVRR